MNIEFAAGMAVWVGIIFFVILQVVKRAGLKRRFSRLATLFEKENRG